MTTISYPLRVPEEILAVSKIRAVEEHIDQATALRQFLHIGAEEFVIQLVADGRISSGKAAELLNLTHYDLYRIAQKHGMKLSATPEQAQKSRATLKRLL